MNDNELMQAIAQGTVEDAPPASVDEAARAAYARRPRGVRRWLRRHPKLATFALLVLVVPATYVMSDCMEGCAAPAAPARHLIFGCGSTQP